MTDSETHRGLVIRVAGGDDSPALAQLRSLWLPGEEVDFERRMADWLHGESGHRTMWLAEAGGSAVGMASLFEYRRMPKPGRPDSAWGYVSNMFVREESRGHGIGAALLGTIVAAAGERGYARLVVSPADLARPLYRRAGFTDAGDGLLVRAESPGRHA